ncbi:MAG TPA: hypothetical protein VGV37_06390 [Aliidongia sp.]|uniref:hypothetical protein n=1 Tax=Aliidongia sp. TaxID=1914230 RepID=UPI002DDD1D1A|nr:hypothetical protein [Aliidongia sp.]HEV2674154.1 hypothetical protein [Aliidongia sp.]
MKIFRRILATVGAAILSGVVFIGSGSIGAFNPQTPSIPYAVQAYRATAMLSSNILLNYIDVTWLGADPTGTVSSSAAFAAAELACTTGLGATIYAPPGKYRAYLDVSHNNQAPCIWRADNAAWLPINTSQTNSTLVYANDCDITYSGTGIKFIGWNFDGRVNGSGAGDINYLLYLNCAKIELQGTVIGVSKAAGIYGFFAQYFRDQDSTITTGTGAIACPVGGPVSGCPWGAYFTGNGTGQSSNELSFLRTRFNTGYNGVGIFGTATATSFNRVEFQNWTVCGASVGADPGGAEASNVAFYSPYFELNTTHLCIGAAQNISVYSPTFLGDVAITAALTSNLTVVNPYGITTSATLNHPSGNTDTVSLNWIGGTFGPTLNVGHPGPTQINIVPGTYATASTGMTFGAGANLHSGTVTPNSNITGNVGDTYVNQAGGTSTTFYVKETGNGTNTGWVAK